MVGLVMMTMMIDNVYDDDYYYVYLDDTPDFSSEDAILACPTISWNIYTTRLKFDYDKLG